MRDGYWINWETGKVLEMPVNGDHEVFIRQHENAKALGVPSGIFVRLKNYELGDNRDRCRLLRFLFRTVPLIRVRGHGVYTTFNYAAKSNLKPYEAIQRFAQRHFGPMMMMDVINFYGRSVRGIRVFPHQFEEEAKKLQSGK